MSEEQELKIYPPEAVERLDFKIIKERLEQFCYGSLGKNFIVNQGVSTDQVWISDSLNQVVEFKEIIENDPYFPDKGYNELPFLSRMKVNGAILTEAEFVKVASFLNTLQGIISFFSLKKREGLYPNLELIVKEVFWDNHLIREIDRVIDAEKEYIKESASFELGKIRKEIILTERKQLGAFDRILKKYKQLGYLSEQNEGVRDGKKVLAVKAEYKRSVQGIYLDDSASGTIAFIEPQETVYLNNELVSLRLQEMREKERILRQLTEFVRPYLGHFKKYEEVLARYDAIRAKAILAVELQACAPHISDNQKILLSQFRHPILFLNYKAKGKQVIANSMSLDTQNHILLISGPNAGGKSVILKSVGLLQLMFQFGLLIPIEEGSSLPVFKKLFVDIGDAQSVENDLSTYSSHLKNLKHFTELSDKHTLVLLDELGHGTDPILGGAMAEAVMEVLLKKKVFAVVTTHYANLKAWGARTEGVENGAMSFDQQHLEPLYRLNIGSPGSSFTFEIARKSGIDMRIIKAAQEKIGRKNEEMEKTLTEIQHEKEYVRGIRKTLQLREKQIESLQKTYEQLNKDFKKEKKILLKRIQEDSLDEFNASNRKLEKLMREWKEDKTDKEKFLKARDYIDRKRLEYEQEPVLGGEQESDESFEITPITVGDHVKLQEGAEVGKILEVRKRKAVVSFGGLTTIVALDRLEKVKAESKSTPRFVADTAQKISEKAAFNSTLDMRGKSKEEAMAELENFLDKALMYGLLRVRVIHGRGTGALRQMVHFLLKSNAMVKSFQPESIELGGDGVTVVDFR